MAILWPRSTGVSRPFRADGCFAQLRCRGGRPIIVENRFFYAGSIPQRDSMAFGKSKCRELCDGETDKEAITVQLANAQEWREALSSRTCPPTRANRGTGRVMCP